VQHRIGPEASAPAGEAPEPESPPELEERLAGFEGPLQDSLRTLGRRVLAGS
jgi:hypothetical protein